MDARSLGRQHGFGCLLLCASASCANVTAVTGGRDATAAGTQSETDATTSFRAGVHRVVVGYNDETNSSATIQYGPSSRKVLRGASLMGWSYSEDYGVTWKYGGKLAPPPGWAVLWGDPALTTSRTNYGMVFFSNLALPDAKFPSGGLDGSVGSAVAGGACIYRSLDGGVSFRFFQCLTDLSPIGGSTPSKGHFFDGGSMAAGPNGEIYASYVDVDTTQAVVFRSLDGVAAFQPMAPPFPNLYVASHPRIRVGLDGTVFVMATAKSGDGAFMLMATRTRNGNWQSPQTITHAEVTPDVDFGSTILGSPLSLRTGPQFAFDIGARSEDRDDSVRFLVTQQNGLGWLMLRGGICDYELRSCGWYSGWTFGAPEADRTRPRMDVFNPNVVAFPGFIGIAPRWQASFLTRFGNSTSVVHLTRANLGYLNGQPFGFPVDIGTNLPLCPDQRGYWGDYDAHLLVGFENDSIQFLRLMTDSSAGCIKRWRFTGERQHVQGFRYDF